jgi:hypothetical protein
MQALTVIEANDIVCYIANCFLVIGIVLPPNALHFQVQEEPFHHGIIPAVAFTTKNRGQQKIGDGARLCTITQFRYEVFLI